MIRLVREQSRTGVGQCIEKVMDEMRRHCNLSLINTDIHILFREIDRLRDLIHSKFPPGMANRLESRLVRMVDGACFALKRLQDDFDSRRNEFDTEFSGERCDELVQKAGQVLELLEENLADIGDELSRAQAEDPSGSVEQLLVFSLVGRLTPILGGFSSAQRVAQVAAGSLVATFSGLIADRAAEGASPEEIANEIESKREFTGFIQPLEDLQSVCSDFQPELSNTAERLNQPGPTQPVDPCPLVERIVSRVRRAIEEAEGILGEGLPLPPDAVAQSLSGCQAEVRQVMEACEGSSET